MTALARVREMLRRGDGRPSESDLKSAYESVHERIREAESQLRQMSDRRRSLLVQGTVPELADHDEQVEELEVALANDRARLEEFKRLRRIAREHERLEALPDLAEGLRAAFAAEREASREHSARFEALMAAAVTLSKEWSLLPPGTARDSTFSGFDPAFADEVERVLTVNGYRRANLPRVPNHEVAEGPVATLGPEGWAFEGEWSERDAERFSRAQRRSPPSSAIIRRERFG